jgi:hypothetical protein
MIAAVSAEKAELSSDNDKSGDSYRFAFASKNTTELEQPH